MVKTLLLLLNVLLWFNLPGQSLAKEGGVNVVEVVRATDIEVPAKAYFKNNTNEVKEYLWYKEIVSMTRGWECAVNDKNLCYSPSTDSMLLVLQPGEQSEIDVHIYPNGIVGEAEVNVFIREVNSREKQIVGTYLFNKSVPDPSPQEEEISIFPNPTPDFFTIRGKDLIAKIEMYNLLGNKVKTFYAYKNKRYSVEDLPVGRYLVRLLDVDNKVISSRQIIKR